MFYNSDFMYNILNLKVKNVIGQPYFKAELNPKAATLDLYAYLVPLLVLNNIPKCKKSQSNHFLTTPTYIHTGGIADP